MLSGRSTQSGTGAPPVPLFQQLDQNGLIVKHRRTLPHWEQSGCSYFVTFRLADSLPPAKSSFARSGQRCAPGPQISETLKLCAPNSFVDR